MIRALALLTCLLALAGAVIVGADLLGLMPPSRPGSAQAAFEAVRPWLLGGALAALPSALFLLRTEAVRAEGQRCLRTLLHEARHLGEEPPATALATAEGPWGEVVAVMRLGGLRLNTALARERAFSGQAAHQLRTPLSVLGLHLDELTLHPQTPRQLRADLLRCRDEVDRLAGIISDLLAVARRGALPAGRYQTDPALVAVHATHRWGPSVVAAGRVLRLVSPLPRCHVPAPAGPAGQVLDVLIDNALKHGSGDIEVSVDVVGDRVRLRVADQGCPDHAARPVPSTGEGMGLRVAKQLADAAGGQLVVAPHPTTAFDLVLPCRRPGGT